MVQINRFAQNQESIHEYDKHIAQLNQELRNAIQAAEEAHMKLRERDMQLQRNYKNDENYQLQVKKL